MSQRCWGATQSVHCVVLRKSTIRKFQNLWKNQYIMFNLQTEKSLDTAKAGSFLTSFYTLHFIPTFHWVGWNISEGQVNFVFLFSQQRVNLVTLLEPVKPNPVASSVETVRFLSYRMQLFNWTKEWSWQFWIFLVCSNHPEKYCSSDDCGGHHVSLGTIR